MFIRQFLCLLVGSLRPKEKRMGFYELILESQFQILHSEVDYKLFDLEQKSIIKFV